MTEGLFREEALAFRRQASLGLITLCAPKFGRAFAAASVVVIGIVLAALVFGRYTQIASADGLLISSGRERRITPATDGTVSQILVLEGVTVVAGQPLVEMSAAAESKTLGNTRAVASAQLRLKSEKLRADLALVHQKTKLELQQTAKNVRALQAQVQEYDSQIELQAERTKSALELSDVWAGATNSGVVPKLQALQQRDMALAHQVQLRELSRQRKDMANRMAEAQNRLQTLPLEEKESCNAIERELTDIERLLGENEAHRMNVVRAPISGVVSNVVVYQGQSVSSRQVLLTVVPREAKLQAEMWVPSRAIGFLGVGQPVNLQYDAFPYQRFGPQQGTIAEVSSSALAPNDISESLGLKVEDTRYRVIVTLRSQTMPAYGRQEALKPGMAVHAEFVLGRRRIIEWILDPMYGLVRRA